MIRRILLVNTKKATILSLSQTSLSWDAGGGTKTVTVTTDADWADVTILPASSESSSYFTITKGSDKTITVTAETNTSTSTARSSSFSVMVDSLTASCSLNISADEVKSKKCVTLDSIDNVRVNATYGGCTYAWKCNSTYTYRYVYYSGETETRQETIRNDGFGNLRNIPADGSSDTLDVGYEYDDCGGEFIGIVTRSGTTLNCTWSFTNWRWTDSGSYSTTNLLGC